MSKHLVSKDTFLNFYRITLWDKTFTNYPYGRRAYSFKTFYKEQSYGNHIGLGKNEMVWWGDNGLFE